jgi:hypothetical protein
LEKGTDLEEIAGVMKVTQRRIYQLKQQYKDERICPELKDPGRKKKPVCAENERVILHAYQIYKSGPVILEKIIKTH